MYVHKHTARSSLNPEPRSETEIKDWVLPGPTSPHDEPWRTKSQHGETGKGKFLFKQHFAASFHPLSESPLPITHMSEGRLKVHVWRTHANYPCEHHPALPRLSQRGAECRRCSGREKPVKLAGFPVGTMVSFQNIKNTIVCSFRALYANANQVANTDLF